MSHKFEKKPHLCTWKNIALGKIFLVMLVILSCKAALANSHDIKWVRVRIAEKQSHLRISAEAITTAKDLNPFQKMSQEFSTAGNVKIESIQTYLDFFRYGCPPHGGMGAGAARMVMKILDLPNIREATYLHRSVHRLTP